MAETAFRQVADPKPLDWRRLKEEGRGRAANANKQSFVTTMEVLIYDMTNSNNKSENGMRILGDIMFAFDGATFQWKCVDKE
jgi:hypothetical protein